MTNEIGGGRRPSETADQYAIRVRAATVETPDLAGVILRRSLVGGVQEREERFRVLENSGEKLTDTRNVALIHPAPSEESRESGKSEITGPTTKTEMIFQKTSRKTLAHTMNPRMLPPPKKRHLR